MKCFRKKKAFLRYGAFSLKISWMLKSNRGNAWVCSVHILNLGEQQETDAYICEIPAGEETKPQRHLFETIVYIHKGRGATTVWFEAAQADSSNGVPARSSRFR